MGDIDDWETEDFDTPKIVEKEFEGGWDDLTPTVEPVVPVSQPSKGEAKLVAAPTKAKKKQLLQESIARKEAEAERSNQLTPDEILRQKKEDERRSKDSDLEHSIDLFKKKVVTTDGSGPKLKSSNEAGFTDLAKQVSDLVAEYAGEEHYPTFLKEVVKNLTAPSTVTSEDVKGMMDTLTTTQNAKIRSEKTGKGKKPAAKKPVAKVGDWSKDRNDIDDSMGGGGGFSEYDDFM
jgi:hypothetical protein